MPKATIEEMRQWLRSLRVSNIERQFFSEECCNQQAAIVDTLLELVEQEETRQSRMASVRFDD